MTKRRGRGEGSIYQRGEDGLWVGEIVIGRTATGKRRKKVVYATTKSELLKKLEKVRARYLLDGTQDGGQMGVGNCLTFWLDTVIAAKAHPNTLRRYRSVVEIHLRPRLGHYKMAEVDAWKIGQVYRDLEKDGLTPSLRYTVAKRLRQFLGYCVRFGLIPANPASKLPLPRYQAAESRFFTITEVGQLLSANRDDRFYPLIYLAIDSGARVSELVAATWDDIDWERSELVINKSASIVKGKGVVISETKTPKSRRRIRLTAQTMAVLRDHQARQAAAKVKSNILFPSYRGTYLRYPNISVTYWPTMLRRAGLDPTVTFHALRHTSASLLLLGTPTSRPVHVKIVSERLGHANVNVTLRTYAHVIPGDQERAVENMESILSNAHRMPTVTPPPDADISA